MSSSLGQKEWHVVTNQYSDDLMKKINTFKTNYLFCDAVLQVGDESFSVHRVILAGCSKYFERIFKEARTKDPPQDTFVANVEKEALGSIINYCYTGMIDFNDDNIVHIQSAATQFQMTKLIEKCNEYLHRELNTNRDSITKTITEIDQFIASERKRIREIIENFMNVYQTSEFLKLSYEKLSEILQSDDLNVPFEDFVIKAVKQWLDYDKKNMEHLENVIKLVKLPLVSKQNLFDVVIPLCENRCNKLVLDILRLHLLPSRRPHIIDASMIPRKSEYKLYAVGISNMELNTNVKMYDPWNDKWFHFMNLELRKNKYGIILVNEKLFFAGGLSEGESLKTVEMIDLDKGILENINSLQTKRAAPGMIVIDENSSKIIYVIGGVNGNIALNTVEWMDILTNRWSYAAPMKYHRHSFGVAVFDNKIYVAGGRNGRNNLNSVEVYNPKINHWETKAPLSSQRNSCSLVKIGDYLYVVGGYEGNFGESPITKIERYDPKTDKWSYFIDLPHNNGVSGVEYFGDTLIAVGAKTYGIDMHNIDLYSFKNNSWKTGTPVSQLREGVKILQVPWNLLYKNSID